jgi:GNAT superfamily N-acetyltransferase
MIELVVSKVRTARERRAFLCFPWRIYKNDPLWIPPLLPERTRIIDSQRGEFFTRGEAEFFVARRGARTLGTICAAVDRTTNRESRKDDCLFGFFECVDDYTVAETLLKRAVDWGRQRNLRTLLGPYHLDYENSYGILVEGRDRPPVLLCGHTPPYYKNLLERFGFTPAYGQNLAYALSLDSQSPQLKRLSRLADRVRSKKWIKIRGAEMDHWDEEVERIHYLLNTSLAHLPSFRPWQLESLKNLLASFHRYADPELILFAEIGGEVVGWFPGLPNLNEVYRHVNGLRFPWNYLQLWRRLHSQPECLAIKSVLVLPKFWSSGVSVLLFDEMAKKAQDRGYKWIDLSLTSTDNPYVSPLAESMGARVYKRYQVYRFQLK